MASIIDLIFDGEIDERNRVEKPKDLSKDKEYIAYEKLIASLSEEQKELLEEIMKEQAIKEGETFKKIYSRGFKLGLLIGLETAKFNPED